MGTPTWLAMHAEMPRTTPAQHETATAAVVRFVRADTIVASEQLASLCYMSLSLSTS